MNSLKISLGLALLTMGAATPALAGDDDWRDRRNASPREVARSYDRVQEERRDLARAQYRGDPRDIREESRELYRAQREFRQDRADLYRAGWDDDRRRGGWDDDDRRRGQKNGRGWGPGGRPANDWRFRQDGWNRQDWHAEQFYRPGTIISHAIWVPMTRSGAGMTTAITAGAAMAPPGLLSVASPAERSAMCWRRAVPRCWAASSAARWVP